MRDYENVSVVNDGETRVWVSIVLRSVPDGALSIDRGDPHDPPSHITEEMRAIV